MARHRRFIDNDVLSEARLRIQHIIDTHDTLAVMFSGGKDSLVTLHLVREVMLAGGDSRPVRVVFRDEEVIEPAVIDFVDGYRQLDWVKMLWLCVPLASHKYILGVTSAYVQWDPGRPWVRDKPPWGVSVEPGDDRVFDQYSCDGFTYEQLGCKGKAAFLTGVRASESAMRYFASVAKLNDNYINAVPSGAKNISLCKPLFDWQEEDIFKYLLDHGIRYCPLYDHNLWAGKNLRVSTPLHAEHAKVFHKLRAAAPEFYDRVIAVFPEMLVHERYYRDLDRQGVTDEYGTTYAGVQRWIEENILDGEERALAMRGFQQAVRSAGKNPELFSPQYLLRQFMAGSFKRGILADYHAGGRTNGRRRAAARAHRADQVARRR